MQARPQSGVRGTVACRQIDSAGVSSTMERLNRLRRPTSPDELLRVRARVVTHLQVLEEHLLADEKIDVIVGRKVAATLLGLIDHTDQLDADGRSLVRAAIDYFVLRDDDDDDLTSPVGLHDDAELLNEVCVLLNRPDLRITFD